MDSEESGSENSSLHKRNKKNNAIPKVDNFSEVLQQEGCIIRELREQYKCNQHDACFIDDGRHIKLTAMHLQCWAKEIVIIFSNLYKNVENNDLIIFVYF